MVLEQFVKLDNFKYKPIRKYNKLSIKEHNAYAIEEFNRN